MTELIHAFTMRPLTEREGGGWLIEFPDLPGCMSDGATPEEALRNGDDAMRCWIEAADEAKRGVPPPYTKALLPVPASLHDELAARLEARGVEAERRVPEILLAGPEKLLPRDPGNQKAPASGPARRHAPVERVGQSLR